ncbi:MAG: hypothetical protein WC178_04630 [Candidatus Paceibacterota bacterium]
MSKISGIKTPDKRSRRFIFIPFCVICQAFQAQGIVRYEHSSVMIPIIEEILKHDLNIIQMPCPESQLGGCENGLKRNPQSIEKYDTPEFREVCEKSATEVIEKIEAILANDYEVVGILGIENSPSCSIKLQYSNKGAYHRPGLFIEALKKQLKKENIEIPLLGINRRGMKITLKRLEQLLAIEKSTKQKNLIEF